MYGTFDPYRMVEWFELLKLLGVDKVVAYSESLDESASRIIRYYQDQGYLDVWHMDPDYLKPDARAISRWRGPVSMTDSLYRYMYQFQRLLGMDIDEVIVPRVTRTLPQLIEKLDKAKEYGTLHRVNYSFIGSFFPANVTNDGHFSFLWHNKRQKRFEVHYRKSIVNPMGCLTMMNHFCHNKIPNFEAKKEGTDVVDTDLAFIHHYSSVIPKSQRSRDIVRDDYLLRYSSNLTSNVCPKLQELGL